MLRLVLFVFGTVLFRGTEGHGMMLDPTSRSSLWRFNASFPTNYNDNELFCGGFQRLLENRGCGLCGDDLAIERPRPNENTGLFGTGEIVRKYQSGQVIEVSVLLTANHKGYFEYSLCDNGDGTAPEPNEECFQPLIFEDGSKNQPILPSDVVLESRIRLPDWIKCDHCVLRWHYRTGNSWGVCDDGSGGLGCGDQEIFRNCADIQII